MFCVPNSCKNRSKILEKMKQSISFKFKFISNSNEKKNTNKRQKVLLRFVINLFA